MKTSKNAVSTPQNEDAYSQILSFAESYNNVNYALFDSYTVKAATLFSMPENYDFEALRNALDVILKALPAIKKIFSHPITHIIDKTAVLPIESVRIINNETISHVSIHSELWDNITNEGLKPRKLLTQDHRDNYAIYENIVFVQTVDAIHRFVRRNIRFLNNILYSSKDMKFNFLDRENHISYFLAIGKLHTGYVRDYSKHQDVAEKCLETLLFIDRVICSRKNTAVYKQCKKITSHLPPKKTNIFRMHKDYHKIYLLAKWFSAPEMTNMAIRAPEDSGSLDGYVLFLSMLTLFSAGHFNFEFDTSEKINFYRLDQTCKFKDWSLNIKTVEHNGTRALKLDFSKDKEYSILVLPLLDYENSSTSIDDLKGEFTADEYLIATSNEEEEKDLLISLFDIESMRRIQQLLLRGMIYSDNKRDICPFCGAPLIQSDEKGNYDSRFDCSFCHLLIYSMTCPETSESFFATKCRSPQKKAKAPQGVLRSDNILYTRHIESALRFKNITKIDADTDIICPRCNKVHK